MDDKQMLYYKVFTSEGGKRLLEDLKEQTLYDRNCNITDPNQLLYLEGKRDLVRYIFTIIKEAEEE